MAAANGLSSVEHIVLLMLENRSFDHMLGFLYTDRGNVSPAGQPYAGLTGSESNPGSSGQPVTVFRIEPTAPDAYFMPGADPGEGYKATNSQLFGSIDGPGDPADVPGCQARGTWTTRPARSPFRASSGCWAAMRSAGRSTATPRRR